MNASTMLVQQDPIASTSPALDPLVVLARAAEQGAPAGNVAIALFAYAVVQLAGRLIDRMNLGRLAPRRVVYSEEDRRMLRQLHGAAVERAAGSAPSLEPSPAETMAPRADAERASPA